MKETDKTIYVQEFKISGVNKECSNVLESLWTNKYNIQNIFLKDVTMDYTGSFDKDKVIHHLMTNKGFRM